MALVSGRPLCDLADREPEVWAALLDALTSQGREARRDAHPGQTVQVRVTGAMTYTRP
ncbi:hypothetical protein [Streptosporangium sp. NPDC087985]|uniref:hypothetical protein n=1 Tax=Streptosporangium sp. NPDC087985 TaxID=3366196 RepID=UPI00380F441B